MNHAKIVGIVLLVCGTLGLAYGGFSYTKSTSDVERDRVNVPIWLGVAFIVVGGGVLLGMGRKA